MALPHDAHEQIMKIDRQILHLLEQRVQLCQRGEGISEEEEEEYASAWLEETLDKDLDETVIEKIGKQIVLLSRKAQE